MASTVWQSSARAFLSRFRRIREARTLALVLFRRSFAPLRKFSGTSRSFGPPRKLYWQPEDYFTEAGADGGRFIPLAKEEPAPPRTAPEFSSPLIADDFRQKMHRFHLDRHVSVFRGGRFWAADHGTVITKDDGIVITLSPQIWIGGPEMHPSFAVLKLPSVRKVSRCYVLHEHDAAGNYWHWMMDLLPRILMLRAAGFEVNDGSYVILPPARYPYQRQTLECLGIAPDKIITSSRRLHLEAEELIVPGHTCLRRMAHDFTHRLLELGQIRGIFKIGAVPANGSFATTGKRLFVSRAGAKRNLQDESAVFAELQKRGFESVRLDGRTVTEQAQLFSEADVVVGVHGAGLTNLLFCRPGATVVEIHSASWLHPCYWDLAVNMRLRYHGYCEAQRTDNSRGFAWNTSASIPVDPQAFGAFIDQVLDSQSSHGTQTQN